MGGAALGINGSLRVLSQGTAWLTLFVFLKRG